MTKSSSSLNAPVLMTEPPLINKSDFLLLPGLLPTGLKSVKLKISDKLDACPQSLSILTTVNPVFSYSKTQITRIRAMIVT